MAVKEAYIPVEEKKGDWKTAAFFWVGAIVAVASGSPVAATAGVVLMGIGAYSWFKNRK